MDKKNKEILPQNSAVKDNNLLDTAENRDILKCIDTLRVLDYDISAEFQKLKQKTNSTRKKTISYRPHIYLGIAASILIIVGFGLKHVFFNESTDVKEFYTAYAEKQTLNLPDGSIVNINADSKIKFDENNWDKDRSLNLEGEAFFKVKKGKTFTVKTSQADISVLGTSFNVKCRNKMVEIICFTGKVKVKSDKYEKILYPGDAAKLENGELVRSWIIKSESPNWLNGITELDSVPLNEALEELKLQFDLEITNVSINDTVTVDFPHDDPEVAIEQVLLPLEIDYTYYPETRELIIEHE